MIDLAPWKKPKKPTLDELKKMLEREGLAYELLAEEPGVKFGRHKHDFDDFVIIVTGKMKIGIEGHEWIMKPGDRLDLPANTPHWAEVVGKEAVQYLTAAK